MRAATRAAFGVDAHGIVVDAITLRNAHAVEVEFLTYGGIVRRVVVPDRAGVLGDVVLGFDTIGDYERDTLYVGALIGRYANRIAHGRFTLDGRDFALDKNDGDNHLHGGKHGFNSAHWSATEFVTPTSVGAVLHHISPDHEQGYPGSLDVRVTYTLTDDNEFVVEHHAEPSEATPVSLTQHSYFNLSGLSGTDILAHELTVNATRFVPVDEAQIPTGELFAVERTPFDFSLAHAIGDRIYHDDEQLQHGGGYDHSYVINRGSDAAVFAARLRDPVSGRTLDISTTEPAVQVCSGNSFDGTHAGKRGGVLVAHAGVALETQHFPDSPNHPHFPSTIVRPDAPYRSRTVYRFLVVS